MYGERTTINAEVKIEGAKEVLYGGDFQAKRGRGRGEFTIGDQDGAETFFIPQRQGFNCSHEVLVALGEARGFEKQQSFVRISEIHWRKLEVCGERDRGGIRGREGEKKNSKKQNLLVDNLVPLSQHHISTFIWVN